MGGRDEPHLGRLERVGPVVADRELGGAAAWGAINTALGIGALVGALSRVSAYDSFGSMAFAPLGPAIWGPVAEAASVGGAIWLATAITFASTLALLCVCDVYRLRTPPSSARRAHPGSSRRPGRSAP